ncbi:MAG: GAF domain-containing protein [Candidatus Auribacterota bacterium]|nr:GAF domain-containing protein [Candidatus Auribacterota bacterium]
MNTVLIASGDIFRRKYIKQLLEKTCQVITSSREGEIVERLAQGVLDLMILDGNLDVGESLSILYRMREANNSLPVIMLVQSTHSPLAAGGKELGVFKVLKIPFEDYELIHWVRKGLAERDKRLQNESSAPGTTPSGVIIPEPMKQVSPGEIKSSRYYIHILQQYSQALLNISDLKRLLSVLVETVKDAFDVRKVSLLLYQPESGKFAIKESSWMDSDLTKNFLLKHEKGLAAWMSKHQRILRKRELETTFTSPDSWEVKRDLEQLQAVMAIPLLAKGKLIGLVACGERFTGEPFSRIDLELFSILSTFFALAIKNALLFQDVSWQKDVSQTIVEHLESGIVTVDQEGLIIAINEAARDALSLTGENLLYRPVSTLGDGPADIIERTFNSRQPVENIEYINPVNNHPLLLSTSILSGEQLHLLWINLVIRDTHQPENILDTAIDSLNKQA